MSRRQFVFGYGSLAARRVGLAPDAAGFIAELAGARRTWGVAMDNRHDLPGYKYYTDSGGRRPRAFVAFLDLRFVDGAGAAVNGLCRPVDDVALAALDLRERNYERVDVSNRIDAGAARVWAYRGTAAARQRFAEGLCTSTVVIDAGYLRAVRAGFAALGEAEERAARASLTPGPIPVAELTRHDLP